MDPTFECGLMFHGANDLVIKCGPLQITSMSTEEDGWGSFEILWDDKWYLYCHYFEETDPYKYATTGYGEPEWVIERMNTKRVLPKTIWSSSIYLHRLWDFYNNVKKKFNAQE